MDYTYYYPNTKSPSSSSTPILIPPSYSRNASNTNNDKNQGNKYDNNNNNNNNNNKKPKARLSTDPQSVAARERRHKISDRFKILQSLIPGGAKLDIVSMLDEAIHYVKFLKAQILLHETFLNNNNNDNNNNNNNGENNDNSGATYYYDQYSYAPIMCSDYCCNDNYVVGDQQLCGVVEDNMVGWNLQEEQIYDLWGYYQQNDLQFIDDKRHLDI